MRTGGCTSGSLQGERYVSPDCFASFRFDIAGSAIVAATDTFVTRVFHLHVAGHLSPLIERPYDLLLQALRLPQAIFPRRIADRRSGSR